MIVLLFAEWLHSGRVESLSLESISLQVLETKDLYLYVCIYFNVFVYIDLQVLDCAICICDNIMVYLYSINCDGPA